MTQEEKLKEAKSLYETANADQRYVLERLFPELKESEDEGIREEIINYFQCQSRDEPTRKDIHNKWIAWLERQDEAAKIEALRTEYEKGRADAIAELKSKEKDVDKIIYDAIQEVCNISDADDAKTFAEHNQTVFDVAKKVLEYKPIRIRSKHAEGKLKELIEKQGYDYSNADIKQKDYAEKQNTNDGFHPLIVEEIDLWIKENENVHHNDKNIIGVMRDMAYQVSALTKNLYNQKQWKPSDEQIRYLQAVVNEPKNAGAESCHNALAKLLGQLKNIVI